MPAWARERGGELEMPAMGHPGELLRSYARLSSRKQDLVLGFPWEQEERLSIVLPDGYAPRRLPEARKIESRFGSFTLAVERQGREVLLSSSLRVVTHRIAQRDYAAFRRFCGEVDGAVGQTLALVHEEARR